MIWLISRFLPPLKGKVVLPIVRQHQDNQRKGILAQLAGHFVYFEQRMWHRKDYKISI